MNRKNIISFLLLIAVFSVSCSDMSKQKKWIYNNIEEKLWNEVTYEAVNDAYQKLKEECSEYVDDQVSSCQSNWRASDAKAERSLDFMLGSSWRELEYYFGDDSRQRTESDRNRKLSAYQDHCIDIINQLCDCYASCLSCFRDSLCVVQQSYDSYDICQELFGSPVSYDEPSVERLYEISETNVKSILQNVLRPKIASCTYDKEKSLWTVRIDNGDNQYVKFYKRDDGDYDIEYGNSLNIMVNLLKLIKK